MIENKYVMTIVPPNKVKHWPNGLVSIYLNPDNSWNVKHGYERINSYIIIQCLWRYQGYNIEIIK